MTSPFLTADRRERCKTCGTVLHTVRGTTRHYGAFEACERIKKAVELLRLYRMKMAVDGLNGRGWHGGAHLFATNALVAAGEPRISYEGAVNGAMRAARAARGKPAKDARRTRRTTTITSTAGRRP